MYRAWTAFASLADVVVERYVLRVPELGVWRWVRVGLELGVSGVLDIYFFLVLILISPNPKFLFPLFRFQYFFLLPNLFRGVVNCD